MLERERVVCAASRVAVQAEGLERAGTFAQSYVGRVVTAFVERLSVPELAFRIVGITLWTACVGG